MDIVFPHSYCTCHRWHAVRRYVIDSVRVPISVRTFHRALGVRTVTPFGFSASAVPVELVSGCCTLYPRRGRVRSMGVGNVAFEPRYDYRGLNCRSTTTQRRVGRDPSWVLVQYPTMVAAHVGRTCYDAASHSIVEFILFEGVDACPSLLVVRLSLPPPCGWKLEMALPPCSLESAPLPCGWNHGPGSASGGWTLD